MRQFQLKIKYFDDQIEELTIKNFDKLEIIENNFSVKIIKCLRDDVMLYSYTKHNIKTIDYKFYDFKEETAIKIKNFLEQDDNTLFCNNKRSLELSSND